MPRQREGRNRNRRETTSKGRKVGYLIAIGGLALLVSLLTGVTQVQPGEIAVVRRFGRVLDERPGPGLYIGLPWGMEQVDRVAIDQVRRVTVGYVIKRDEDVEGTPTG